MEHLIKKIKTLVSAAVVGNLLPS